MRDIGGGTNSVGYRLHRLEEDVRELKQGQPAVVAERVGMLSLRITELRTEFEKDIGELRDEVKGVRRILIGAFSTLSLGLVVAYVLGGGGVPT